MFYKKSIPSAITAVLMTSAVTFNANAGQIAFDSTPFPTSDTEKASILSSANIQVNGNWQPSGFQTLLRSGDVLPLLVGTTPSGSQTAKFGGLIKSDGSELIDPTTNDQAISDSNDFNSLITAGGNLFLVSHFETRPGAMYLTLLHQAADGTLSAEATRPIDFSAVKGGWVHCAGSVTPWGTHMGSEEYEPNARQWVDGTIDGYNSAMAAYFDPTGWTFNKNNPLGSATVASTTMNPYDYGWPVEVKVNVDGSTDVTKHFAMGRSANELSYVMPDQKTVYITDDGTNTLVEMFIADTAGNMSAGTLYAAKWVQLANNAKGGSARLEWVDLGHATSTQVKTAIDAGTKFNDLFDYTTEEPGPCVSNGRQTINKGHEGVAGDYECLKIKAGADETVVSRLETRRYAALKGATTEFRKVEGFTYNPERRTAYLAMSEINKGMVVSTAAASNHKGGKDHIQLTKNDCGAVYAMRVGGIVRDSAGKVIASNFVARTMDGLVAGTPVSGDSKNTCNINGIANPDNVTYLPRYNSLVIGEDTGSGHRNDAIWNYNLLNGSLTRIQTTPYGSETTSPYWYPDLNGHGYMTSVVQHPYGESDQTVPHTDAEERGYVGYFKFPVLK